MIQAQMRLINDPWLAWRMLGAVFAAITLLGRAVPAHAQTPSKTAIIATASPSHVGDVVDFVVTVAGVDGGTATGTVTFNSGDGTSLTATLSDGRANIRHAYAAAGVFLVTATYHGDVQSLTSRAAAAQTVEKAATTTTIYGSSDPSRIGQSVVFNATVSAAAGTPTGVVTFDFGDGSAAMGVLAGGVTKLSHSYASAGSFTVTATYRGDTNFFTGVGTTEQAVEPVITTATVGSRRNSAKAGPSVTLGPRSGPRQD